MGCPGPQFIDSCTGKYLAGRKQARGYVTLEFVYKYQILSILPQKSSLISCFFSSFSFPCHQSSLTKFIFCHYVHLLQHTSNLTSSLTWNIARGNEKWYSNSGTEFGGFLQTKHAVTLWSKNCTLGHLSQRNENLRSYKSCTKMSTVLFGIAKNWKQSRCPSMGDWLNTLGYIHRTD